MQVHESFRSENILFFTSHTSDANGSAQINTSEKLDLTQPWIFGFEFSRPDSFFSAGFIDICPDRDVYRHSERQGQPLTTFKKIHDIYALGIVLLEIGKKSRNIFSAPSIWASRLINIQGFGDLPLRWRRTNLPTPEIRKDAPTVLRNI